MKIEIGESLMYSWMRHVKGCRVVQLNWKTSPCWDVSPDDKQLMEVFFSKVKDVFSEDGFDVFRQANGVDQSLKQVECDVFGVYEWSGVPVAIVAESAFHENGLNYGSKEVTCAKVIAKMARAAMALRVYLPWIHQSEIVFSSPKVHKNVMELLEPAIEKLNAVLSDSGLSCHVRLVANETFNAELLMPVLDACSAGVADTSELFLRSMQLYKMFDGADFVVESTQNAPVNVQPVNAAEEVSIGKRVQTTVRELLESGRCSEEEIVMLTKVDYCRQVFGLYFPLLSREQVQTSGQPRYYASPVTINGNTYYLCSQWYARQRSALERWIAKHLA